MRKTVDEWLGSHQNGMGMAKKKIGRKKSVAGLPLPTEAAAMPKKKPTPKKKPARMKPKRKPR